jgi:PiT family inorganic phosphate transporter
LLGVWNLITWRLGLPNSPAHALIGGLAGAAIAAATDAHWSGVVEKVVIRSSLQGR